MSIFSFATFFFDIDYKNVIDKKYLPINFDTQYGNKKRQEFEAQFDKKEYETVKN